MQRTKAPFRADEVGSLVRGHDLVTLGTQLGEDAFGVDQGFGAA